MEAGAVQDIAARTVTLDSWQVQALQDWHTERSAVHGVPHQASVLYAGYQPLASTSAQAGADQQVRKALEIADLRREVGLSAGSLRLWGAARLVTSFATLEDGAAAAGIEWHTLHRLITQGGDRNLQLAA